MNEQKTESWEKEFEERFNYFPDSYYNFVVGKTRSEYDNVTSDLNDIKAFIRSALKAQREEMVKRIDKAAEEWSSPADFELHYGYEKSIELIKEGD
mgnify:CR=1 FL=1